MNIEINKSPLVYYPTKISLLVLLVLTPVFSGLAQSNLDANRTLTTKIADLLNQFPADNERDLNNTMENMANLGAEGLYQMALMLSENGNNEKLEYALSGFAFYANQTGKESYADKVIEGYGKAIPELDYDAGKVYLISKLQFAGNDKAVPYLEPYLDNPALAGPASRALAAINSSASESALIQALGNSDNEEVTISLVEALGDAKSVAALSRIENLARSESSQTKKVALYALANIGQPSSSKTMLQAADAVDYQYEDTNASSMLLAYANNLAKNGYQKEALSIAKKLHKNTKTESQFHTKTGALKLLTDLDPKNATKLLQKAALSDNTDYRAAALKFALANNIVDFATWGNVLEKGNDEAKVSLIQALGQSKNPAVLELVRPFLQNNNTVIRTAAIRSAVLIGNNQVLPELLTLIDSADPEETEEIKTSLLIMKGDDVTSEIAKAIPQSSDSAKPALIQVLGARSASPYLDVVLKEAGSENREIQKAVFASLSNMSMPTDLDKLITLLKAEKEEENLLQIQAAIIAANKRQGSKRKQAQWTLTNLNNLPVDKQMYLYQVLASTGSKEALKNLEEIYNSGNSDQKVAALSALTNWPNANASTVLFQIAENEGNNGNAAKALTGFINLIESTQQKEENKVILLRNALEIAKTEDNKKLIFTELAKYPTFQALLVAGEHLSDPVVQQQAARAVMNISQSNENLTGEKVRGIIQKTIEVISGQDSEYYKTSMRKHLDEMPEGKGFYAIFNGKNLDGWKGLVANPIKRSQMSPQVLAREQEKADKEMREGWVVEDGLLVFTGKGNNLATEKMYGDFEMFVDWKITEDGDAGIYLRGTPQVQIWDIARVDVGAQVGSGGLYNNQTHPSKPLKVADNPVGEWNTFYIKMEGDKVTVKLNGELVVDNVVLENFWDRKSPIFPEEQIELQAHGTYVAYRDIYIREISGTEPFRLSEEEEKEGYEILFDGTNMDQWMGNTTDYVIDNGVMAIYPDRGGKGNLFTKEEYSDFVYRFEFKLTPGANNGLGIRSPLEGDAAYVGMELQILDDTADIYKDLEEYQYHGSLYGIAAAKRGFLKPVGEWNYQEVRVEGTRIQVELNGNLILDTDIADAIKNGTKDGRDHPGLKRDKGHIGFLGHGDVVFFRNIRIKDLGK